VSTITEYKKFVKSELWTDYQETTTKLTQEWTKFVHQKGQSLQLAQREDMIHRENWQIKEKVR
jgi:23S rRNA maturation mini-RNase III